MASGSTEPARPTAACATASLSGEVLMVSISRRISSRLIVFTLSFQSSWGAEHRLGKAQSLHLDDVDVLSLRRGIAPVHQILIRWNCQSIGNAGACRSAVSEAPDVA